MEKMTREVHLQRLLAQREEAQVAQRNAEAEARAAEANAKHHALEIATLLAPPGRLKDTGEVSGWAGQLFVRAEVTSLDSDGRPRAVGRVWADEKAR